MSPPSDPAASRARLEAEAERLRARFPQHPQRHLWILIGVGAVDAADRTILATVFEDVKRAFDVSDSQLGLLTAAYSVVATLSVVPFGWVADRWSRVRLIAIGFVPWSLAMIWTGAASSFAMMFVARLFLGSIEATNGPATPSLLGDYYPVARRGRMMGTLAVGGLIGSVSGFALGGIIASLAGWRASFFIWGGLGFVCAAAVLQLLPEPERGLPDAIHRLDSRIRALRRGEQGQDEVPGAAETTNAETDPGDGPDHDYRRLSIRQAVREIARVRTMWIVFVAGSMGEFFMSGLVVWAPTFFRRYHGLNAAAAGGLVAFLAMSAAGGMLIGGRIGDRMLARDPSHRIRLAGLAMLSAFGFLFVAFRFDEMALIIPCFLVAGFLLGLPSAPLGAVGLDVLVPHLRGRAGALRALLRVAGTASAPLLFGYLSDLHGLRSALLFTMPALLANGAIILLAVPFYPRDMARAQAEAVRQQQLQEAERDEEDGGDETAGPPQTDQE